MQIGSHRRGDFFSLFCVYFVCIQFFARCSFKCKKFFSPIKNRRPPCGGLDGAPYPVELTCSYSSLRWERGRQGAPCPEGDLIMIIMRIYNNLSNEEFMNMIDELKVASEMCYFGKPQKCNNCGKCPN